MKNSSFICVDLQNDFASEGGTEYKPRASIGFIKETLIPYFKLNNIKTAEIISDYRQPRPGDRGDCCHPGEWGYESIISQEIKKDPVWVKSMNSPIWTRDNIGNPNEIPGIPYQDGDAFQSWLDTTVGRMNEGVEVYVFGLTADCCVLSTAQELNWRGYKVFIIKEATDTYSGNYREKVVVLGNPPLLNWAEVIDWEEVLQ